MRTSATIDGDDITIQLTTENGTVILTEDQALAITRELQTAVRQVQLRKERAHMEEIARRLADCQRIEEVGGHKFRVQMNFPEHGGNDTAVWLDGFTRETAPFVIQKSAAVEVIGTGNEGRPWLIQGAVRQKSWGMSADATIWRPPVLAKNTAPLRFATWGAAAMRALAMNLHEPVTGETAT